MKIHDDSMYRLLRFLSECYNLEKGVKITKEMIDIDDEDYYGDVDDRLEGYTVKVIATDGEHKSDYQIVDYTIQFTSPDKKKTKLIIQRSLVNGWHTDEPNYNIK